jgi:uncharacterized membrane protein (UPF0127 family)
MSRQSKRFVPKSFNFLIFFLIASDISASEPISLEKILPNIEVVSKFQDRQKGLMYKKAIPEDYGMFFIWSTKKVQCMWMKNTYIPLSVAYMDRRGKIINIYDMVPLSKISVCSDRPALYALEVNRGWFKTNNIKVGDILDLDKILQND